MPATRTDVHRPTALVTEDYDYAYSYDAHPTEGSRGDAMPMLHALIADGWHFGQVHGGDTCDHCGHALRYVAVLKHRPSHTLIKVGEQCLANRFDLATADFHALRKAAALNRDRMALKDKLAAFLNESPDNRRAYDWLTTKVADGDYGGGFYFDLLHKANRYGEMSERQVAAVIRAIDRDAERAEQQAKDAETAAPVIEGRIAVTGTVLSVKWQDNDFGGRLVMTVRDDRGFKVWGTVPSGLDKPRFESLDRDHIQRSIDAYAAAAATATDWSKDYHLREVARLEQLLADDDGPRQVGTTPVDRGDRVTFTATITKSDRDETFGFFKRPTKAAVLDSPQAG